MGISQVAAASIKSSGIDGRLNMERMPVTGFLYTSCANALITDSAAAGTALATGHRTNGGVVSMSTEGETLYTILEASRDMGLSTGMVVTYPVTNATPATFASHVKSRSEETEIAAQYLKSGINVLLGGGKQFFLPQSCEGSKRTDDRDLLAEAKKLGYTFVETKEELLNTETDYLLGLFELDRLSYNPEPSLAEMTAKTLALLSRNEKGFFLMVEGSMIDRACHANDMDKAILQTVLFDKAVKAGLDFAMSNRETLIIVTADHETGGMGITGGKLDGQNLRTGWLWGSHTAVPVPIFAFGAGAEKFMGVGHLTDVPEKIARLLGIKNFPQTIHAPAGKTTIQK